MARWRRLLASLCAAVLVVGLLAGTQAMADEVDIYIMAENDQMLNLPLEAMPVRIGGNMYVPYHAFDWTYTGVNLGVSYGQEHSGSKYLFSLYSLEGTLVFDVNAGTCQEAGTGEDMEMKAVVRNGRVFVPLTGVCRYFGLSYSYTPTQYGTLIRITNGQEWLSTSKFVDSATNSMRVRYNEYMEALAAASSPAASASVNTGATVRPSSTPEDDDQRQLTVAVAFQCTGEGADELLDALERTGIRALLLFRPEELADNEAAIRRAVGSGHTVGLSIRETSARQAMEEAEKGSAWLEDYLRLRPHIVYLEAGDGEAQRAMAQAGWACWSGGLDARDDGRSQSVQRSALLRELEKEQGLVRVLLDDSETVLAMLPQAVSQMRGEGYSFHLTVETDL